MERLALGPPPRSPGVLAPSPGYGPTPATPPSSPPPASCQQRQCSASPDHSPPLPRRIPAPALTPVTAPAHAPAPVCGAGTSYVSTGRTAVPAVPCDKRSKKTFFKAGALGQWEKDNKLLQGVLIGAGIGVGLGFILGKILSFNNVKHKPQQQGGQQWLEASPSRLEGKPRALAAWGGHVKAASPPRDATSRALER